MKLNQFAVYRVDQQTAGKTLWHLFFHTASSLTEWTGQIWCKKNRA